MHINKVTLLGTISDEPKLIDTKGGSQLCKLNILTEKIVKKKDGSEVPIKNFHRCTIWGDSAKDAGEMQVGDPVYVEGELQYGSYTDKDGIKKYTTDVNVGFDGKVVLFPSGGVSSDSSDNPFN